MSWKRPVQRPNAKSRAEFLIADYRAAKDSGEMTELPNGHKIATADLVRRAIDQELGKANDDGTWTLPEDVQKALGVRRTR